jgi:hypothetical protein
MNNHKFTLQENRDIVTTATHCCVMYYVTSQQYIFPTYAFSVRLIVWIYLCQYFHDVLIR